MSLSQRPFAARSHPAWWAFVLHRISGLVLVLFLPLHLYVLSRALENSDQLDRLLTWAEMPVVKLAETLLVILFAAHMTGGLRLLAIEFLPWQDRQKTLIAIATGTALAIGLIFMLSAFGGLS